MTKISKPFPDSEFVKQYMESRADNVHPDLKVIIDILNYF